MIDNPIRTSSDIDSLSISNTDDLGYVGESIQQVVEALAGRVPVIGFVGAPFTLASYMIEGGPSRDVSRDQADDVSRRDAVAASDGQACRRARLICAVAGFSRRSGDPGFRQLGWRARTG